VLPFLSSVDGRRKLGIENGAQLVNKAPIRSGARWELIIKNIAG
jgi:hypothetical protein